MPGRRFETNLSDILEAFDHLWRLLGGPGAIWGSTGVASVPKCAIWHSCAGGSADLERFAGFWARISGGLWQPVAACGGGVDPL